MMPTPRPSGAQRKVGVATALARHFDDPDLTLALALPGAVDKQYPERRRGKQ